MIGQQIWCELFLSRATDAVIFKGLDLDQLPRAFRDIESTMLPISSLSEPRSPGKDACLISSSFQISVPCSIVSNIAISTFHVAVTFTVLVAVLVAQSPRPHNHLSSSSPLDYSGFSIHLRNAGAAFST